MLLGNDAADSGDFQVGIRLAYELGWPVVNGVTNVSVADGVVTASGDGPDGHETYRVPLPAVVTILEGGVEPRYPTVPGRMKAKKVAIEERRPAAEPAGPEPGQAAAAATGSQQRADPRQGRRRRARRGRPVRAAGGARPMILVLVEKDLDGVAVEVSREALTFARSLSAAGGGVPIDAVVVGDVSPELREQLAAYGVRDVHRLGGESFAAFAGAGWASGIETVLAATKSVVVMAAGTERGNEVLAHVAARAGVAMAANVLSFGGLSPFTVTRQVVGGQALEEMRLGRPAGGLHGRRPCRRGGACRNAGSRDRGRACARGGCGRPGRPGGVVRGARARPVRLR